MTPAHPYTTHNSVYQAARFLHCIGDAVLLVEKWAAVFDAFLKIEIIGAALHTTTAAPITTGLNQSSLVIVSSTDVLL